MLFRSLRRLRYAAEEVKMELGRSKEAALFVSNCFVIDGNPVDVDLWLEQSIFAGRLLPLVDRSLDVCSRLLARHGLAARDLDRVVLVGGPTVMPLLRDRVAEVLGAPFAQGLDPMTLVARGAALHAATVGLELQSVVVKEEGREVWLQYPTVS